MRNWGSRKEAGKKSIRPAISFCNRMPILILVLAFLFNVTVPYDLAWAVKTDAMPSPIGEENSVGSGPDSLLGPNEIDVPRAFGTVKERFQQDKDPKGLIVHIQDLHTHYQAHKNISYIIEHLSRKHDIGMVFTEAKMTDRGFAYLRPWTKESVRKKVAEEYLKKGILTAWESLDLTSDLDLTLQGIEDKDLYIKDMDAFLKAETFRPEALKFTDLLKNITDNLKLHMYSRRQRAFDEKMASYRDETQGIAEYTDYLTKLAKKYEIEHEGLVNLAILQETLQMEDGIDFNRAETERERVIDDLSKRLLDTEMKSLLNMSMKFKANRISQHEFYQYLAALADKMDISMKRFPNLDLYTKYVTTYHRLDASKLFEEINGLEDKIAALIFTEDDQKRLFEISKNLSILRGLVDFKLTPDEFNYYNKTKSGFDVANWLEFIKLHSEYFKLTQYVPSEASIIKDNISILEDFYKVARERDDAFVKNIDNQFGKRDIEVAMLMTGGFHTPGVTRRLKEAGYSYVVISPRIEEEMDYDKYYEILKASYEDLRAAEAIGAVSGAERGPIVTALTAQIASRDGINLATAAEERDVLGARGDAVAVVLVEGEDRRAIISPEKAERLLTADQLARFLEYVEMLRRGGRITEEEQGEFEGLVELASTPPEDRRGSLHHENLALDNTLYLRNAIADEEFAAVGLGNDGRARQTDLYIDEPIVDEEVTLAERGWITNDEQRIRLTEEQLELFDRAVAELGIVDLGAGINLLEGYTIIFRAAQPTHFGLGRRQIYMDIALLSEAKFETLRSDLNHELFERTEIIERLAPELKAELERTATDWLKRSEKLRREIATLADEAHNRAIAWQNRTQAERPLWRELAEKYGEAEGVTTYVYVHEGKVEAERVADGRRTLLTFEQAAEVGRDSTQYVTMPEERAGILAADEVQRFVGEVDVAREVVNAKSASRARVIKERTSILPKFTADSVGLFAIDVDTIAPNIGEFRAKMADPKAEREFMVDLAQQAEAMGAFKIVPGEPSNVYFDYKGDDAELIKEVRRRFYSLPYVMANIDDMRLWSDISGTRAFMRIRDVKWVSTGLNVDVETVVSPVLLRDETVFDAQGRGLNVFDYDLAFLAGFRMAGVAGYPSARTPAFQGTRRDIEQGLEDESSDYYKLSADLARLCRIEQGSITAEHIANLFDHTNPKYESFLRTARLVWHRITMVSWENLRRLGEILREVEFSI